MQQTHTFANHYKPTHKPKFAKECVCPTAQPRENQDERQKGNTQTFDSNPL
jgi:hypothetical protein